MNIHDLQTHIKAGITLDKAISQLKHQIAQVDIEEVINHDPELRLNRQLLCLLLSIQKGTNPIE